MALKLFRKFSYLSERVVAILKNLLFVISMVPHSGTNGFIGIQRMSEDRYKLIKFYAGKFQINWRSVRGNDAIFLKGPGISLYICLGTIQYLRIVFS